LLGKFGRIYPATKLKIMSKRISKIKARKIIGDFYVIPRNWNFQLLQDWWRKNKDYELEKTDVEVVSLLEKVKEDKKIQTIAEIVERGDFGLNKPVLVG
jgi:hypothetical protein